MRVLTSVVLAAAVASGGPAVAASKQTEAEAFLAVVQRIGVHYAMLLARSFVDLTYDQLTIEPGTGHMVLTGLSLYPELEWDQDAACEITIDRFVSGEHYGFETVRTGMEMTGVNVPTACFEPEVGGMMSSFGYDGITAETMSIEIAYSLPDSSAELAIHAAVANAADLSIDAEFGYFWLRFPIDSYDDEPVPVMQLSHAEIVIENKGLWERLEPMVGAQMGDINAVPQMIQMMVGEALTEGGTRTPGEAENAFVANLGAEVKRFLEQKNRLVITAAPEGGVWLDESVFEAPQNMIAALRPSLSAIPSAFRAIVPPDVLTAAVASGASPDDETRLNVGRALVTGIGAPLSRADGIRLLTPLAEAWNGEAAVLAGQAAAALGRTEEAYAMALRALAVGELGALSLADELERELAVGDILAAQDPVCDSFPGSDAAETAAAEAISAGDVGAIRAIAQAASVGRGLPRCYEIAYTAAVLAAAGGDRAAANLRERMDRRFGGEDAAGWTEVATRAASEALSVWTSAGFGAAIAARAQ